MADTDPHTDDSPSSSILAESTTKMTEVFSKALAQTQTSDVATALISIKLDGTNYALGSEVVEMYISSKDKLRYINGNLPQPPLMDPTFRRWRTDNAIVNGWLITNFASTLMAPNALTMGVQSILVRPTSNFTGIPIGGMNSRLESTMMEVGLVITPARLLWQQQNHIFPLFQLRVPNLTQDILTKEIIGRGTKRGLYYMDDFSVGRAHHMYCLSDLKVEHILLWHHRLSHPSFGYLQHVFPDLFSGLSSLDLKC
ncbi:uncharacterized protein LOC130781057 [Actinidia eriantha]|uniref:uncharacterized protein LOC130781057 n=1 Tax=Actinidia eriantha TaxID=165200 RepID=UPI00258433D3|nr:uncharacterized protein LOC130781057 [Actinidia eriantha]